MAFFGLLHLVTYSGDKIATYYPANCAEELKFIEGPLDSNELIIPNYYDAIRELFLVITLPPLLGDWVWKDNLLSHLIDKVEIQLEAYGTTIMLPNEYIRETIAEVSDKLPGKMLFYGLSDEKRRSMSRKGFQLTFPIKLATLINNPAELYHYPFHNHHKIRMHFNNSGIVEDHDEYQAFGIQWGIKMMGAFYDCDTRTALHTDLMTTISGQIVSNKA